MRALPWLVVGGYLVAVVASTAFLMLQFVHREPLVVALAVQGVVALAGLVLPRHWCLN